MMNGRHVILTSVSSLRHSVISVCVAVFRKNEIVVKRHLKWLCCECGATTLEFALSAVVLLSIVLGVMETSLALYSFDLVCDAAREGARYAMVRGNTCMLSGASCTATTTQIQTYVRSLGFPGINVQSMTVSATYSGFPSGTTCTPNANCANPGNLVTVKVVYPFAYNIPFAPSKTLQLSSTSAMVISQ